MGNAIKFYAFVIRIALLFAMAGQLKGCTLTMMGMAAEKTERGIISYSKISRMLTSDRKSTGHATEGGIRPRSIR